MEKLTRKPRAFRCKAWPWHTEPLQTLQSRKVIIGRNAEGFYQGVNHPLGFPCHAGIPWKISWRKSCLKCFLKEFLGIWEENPRFNRNGRIQACMNHVVIWVSQNGGLPNLFPCQEQLNWYTGKWNVIFTVIIQLKLNWRVSSKFLWQKIWIQIFRAALCGKKAPSGFNWDKQASVNGHIGKRLHSYATTEIKAFMLDRADR